MTRTEQIQDTLDELARRYNALQVAVSSNDVSTRGGANRLADFNHDLKAVIRTLEIQLDEAGR